MSIELYKNRISCSGCTACRSICPVKAITMQPDEDGFIYPQINDDKCIHCNLCKKVCAYQNDLPECSYKEAYVAVSQTTDISTSASGGLFSALARSVLIDGGIVYGCAMIYKDNSLHVRHIRADTFEKLETLKGSKYVQSNMQGIYSLVLEDLKAGITVLFSGTPCQVAGLKGYLQKDYNNLFTVDLICHGVPSEKLFKQYIAFEEQKHKLKITNFCFRDKSKGWKLHGSIAFENGQNLFFEPEKSSYYQLFLNSYTYRESCYSCPYASQHRPGDVTIGDYWCIDLIHPELLVKNGGQIDEHKGVSCMIVNNDRGRELLLSYGNGIARWESSYENTARYNRQLTAPSVQKPERDVVLELARNNYAELDKWYRIKQRPIIIKRAIRQIIPTPVKRIIKKYLLVFKSDKP